MSLAPPSSLRSHDDRLVPLHVRSAVAQLVVIAALAVPSSTGGCTRPSAELARDRMKLRIRPDAVAVMRDRIRAERCKELAHLRELHLGAPNRVPVIPRSSLASTPLGQCGSLPRICIFLQCRSLSPTERQVFTSWSNVELPSRIAADTSCAAHSTSVSRRNVPSKGVVTVPRAPPQDRRGRKTNRIETVLLPSTSPRAMKRS